MALLDSLKAKIAPKPPQIKKKKCCFIITTYSVTNCSSYLSNQYEAMMITSDTSKNLLN